MTVAQDAQHKWRTQSKARRREARQLEREERMKQGTEVTKSAFTSQRRSNVRWLMLSEDGNELCWGASRKGKKKRVRVRTSAPSIRLAVAHSDDLRRLRISHE